MILILLDFTQPKQATKTYNKYKINLFKKNCIFTIHFFSFRGRSLQKYMT